jgi:hypothetical protein
VCGAPLLTDRARATLVAHLSGRVAQAIADEEDARRHKEVERVRAAGAFPELGGGSSSHGHSHSHNAPSSRSKGAAAAAGNNTNASTTQEPQFHKVLSLTGKGKVTATITRISPSPSSTSLHAKGIEGGDDNKPKPVHVPPPPEGPEYVKLAPGELKAKRRFENLRGEGPVYVPLLTEEEAVKSGGGTTGRSRRPRDRRSRKKQGKENQPQQQQLLLEAGPSNS